MGEVTAASPDHVVVIILDSLNRHLLGAYGSEEFETPHLDTFASQSIVFDRHHAGSLPCMPARHDLLVGALDFPWRPWGSIEIWEDAVTRDLRRAGVTTMLVSDHPHLFEVGGENYHTDFTAWEYTRGHENDPWRTVEDPTWIGSPALPVARNPRAHFHYDTSRTWFRDETDFPGPSTMRTAAAWIRANAGRHSKSFLLVDEFDPHEPFDAPEPWASKYRDHQDDPWLIWPPYAVDALAKGVLSPAEARSLRAAYGAKLSMIDHWLGEVLRAIDEGPDADRTAVVVCTDHGHYLGERGVWGKPAHPIHDPLGHIPLMIRWPGADPRRTRRLTTTVDIHATLCDVFGVRPTHRTHGRSLIPVIESDQPIREAVLSGYWGREVLLVTDDISYTRGSVGAGFPLSMWSNRWSTMPIHARPDIRLPLPDARARLDRMPGSEVPVIRQPFVEGDLLPFWAYGGLVDTHLLYDRRDDPEQLVNLSDPDRPSSVESEATELLRHELAGIEAPDDLMERLGLT